MIPDLTDTTTWPDETLDALRVQVLTEQERRTNLTAIPQTMTDLNQKYLTAEGIIAGSEWRAPSGVQDAYPAGWEVTHAGKTWASLTPFNVWVPGESGWREVVAEGHPTWVQPTGEHDAYPLGARVTHNGQDWESTNAANVWEPGVFGWVTI